MRQTGRYSNHQEQIESLLETLLDPVERFRRAKLLAAIRVSLSRAEPAPRQLRLSQGTIQAAILDVLAATIEPLYTRDIHTLVVDKLGQQISYDTVCSCLTVAVKRADSPIKRVSRGLYQKRAILVLDGDRDALPRDQAGSTSA